MKIQIIKTVQKIQQFCEEYLQKKIDLLTLQQGLSAIYSNFENDIPQKLQDEIHNFIEDLEYTQFMSPENEKFDVISTKILKLNAILSNYSAEDYIKDN